MNKAQQKEHFRKFTQKMGEILESKGDDYANDADRLSNFKFAGNGACIGAAKACLSQICIKAARLGVLLNDKKTPNNESISDSILDLANYAILLDMIVNEE